MRLVSSAVKTIPITHSLDVHDAIRFFVRMTRSHDSSIFYSTCADPMHECQWSVSMKEIKRIRTISRYSVASVHASTTVQMVRLTFGVWFLIVFDWSEWMRSCDPFSRSNRNEQMLLLPLLVIVACSTTSQTAKTNQSYSVESSNASAQNEITSTAINRIDNKLSLLRVQHTIKSRIPEMTAKHSSLKCQKRNNATRNGNFRTSSNSVKQRRSVPVPYGGAERTKWV